MRMFRVLGIDACMRGVAVQVEGRDADTARPPAS
jgi:hypothetical protein